MLTTLHILTKSDDSLAREIISRQRTAGGVEVKVVDLTTAEPDYAALLVDIFAAESLAVW